MQIQHALLALFNLSLFAGIAYAERLPAQIERRKLTGASKGKVKIEPTGAVCNAGAKRSAACKNGADGVDGQPLKDNDDCFIIIQNQEVFCGYHYHVLLYFYGALLGDKERTKRPPPGPGEPSWTEQASALARQFLAAGPQASAEQTAREMVDEHLAGAAGQATGAGQGGASGQGGGQGEPAGAAAPFRDQKHLEGAQLLADFTDHAHKEAAAPVRDQKHLEGAQLLADFTDHAHKEAAQGGAEKQG